MATSWFSMHSFVANVANPTNVKMGLEVPFGRELSAGVHGSVSGPDTYKPLVCLSDYLYFLCIYLCRTQGHAEMKWYSKPDQQDYFGCLGVALAGDPRKAEHVTAKASVGCRWVLDRPQVGQPLEPRACLDTEFGFEVNAQTQQVMPFVGFGVGYQFPL